jgi:hypothetical protein
MINICIILANQGKHVQTINYYENALTVSECLLDKTYPNHTFILCNMAFSCIEISDDFRAEKLIICFCMTSSHSTFQ